MSLADIDPAVTRIRIQDIADTAKKAFEAHAERSAQLDAEAQAIAAKEKADLEAALQRQAEAKQAAAKQADAQQEEQPKPPPKRATMSLGAEEFKLDREARQAADRAKPTPEPPAPQEPEPAPKEERPSKTLKLGARDEQTPAQQDRPARKRPPRPEADDDMSGRTWLR